MKPVNIVFAAGKFHEIANGTKIIATLKQYHSKSMSESIDHEDIQLLVGKIQQREREIVEQNNRIKKLREELEEKCKQNADDHKKQLDLRIELMRKLWSLVTESNGSVAEFQALPDEAVRDSDGCSSRRDDQLQDADRLISDPYLPLTELENTDDSTL